MFIGVPPAPPPPCPPPPPFPPPPPPFAKAWSGPKSAPPVGRATSRATAAADVRSIRVMVIGEPLAMGSDSQRATCCAGHRVGAARFNPARNRNRDDNKSGQRIVSRSATSLKRSSPPRRLGMSSPPAGTDREVREAVPNEREPSSNAVRLHRVSRTWSTQGNVGAVVNLDFAVRVHRDYEDEPDMINR